MAAKEVLLCLAFFLRISHGYQILGIFPHMGKSHFDAFEPLMKALANKGHEVVLLTYFQQKNSVPNLTIIDLSAGLPSTTMEMINDFDGSRYLNYFITDILAYFGWIIFNFVLTKPEITQLIQSKPKFDLVMIEVFNNNCLLGLAHLMNAPIIGLSSSAIMPWHGSEIGIPTNPAYIPNVFLPNSGNMTFFVRVENVLLNIAHNLAYKFKMEAPSDEAVATYLGANLPPVSEIQNNISLLLANIHHTISTVRPLVPGYIEVGGMFLGIPKNPPQVVEATKSLHFMSISFYL